MLFDRDFPLGVEERVMRDRYRYAIQHSGLHRTVHRHKIQAGQRQKITHNTTKKLHITQANNCT